MLASIQERENLATISPCVEYARLLERLGPSEFFCRMLSVLPCLFVVVPCLKLQNCVFVSPTENFLPSKSLHPEHVKAAIINTVLHSALACFSMNKVTNSLFDVVTRVMASSFSDLLQLVITKRFLKNKLTRSKYF